MGSFFFSDEREFGLNLRDNFSYFSLKPYIVTPHLNPLAETAQMMGHNICFFFLELIKIIPYYHQILSVIKSLVLPPPPCHTHLTSTVPSPPPPPHTRI